MISTRPQPQQLWQHLLSPGSRVFQGIISSILERSIDSCWKYHFSLAAGLVCLHSNTHFVCSDPSTARKVIPYLGSFCPSDLFKQTTISSDFPHNKLSSQTDVRNPNSQQKAAGGMKL